MDNVSKNAELERLIDEVEHLRVKLSIARDSHTRDGETLERLERSIALVEGEIAKTKKVIGKSPGTSRPRASNRR